MAKNSIGKNIRKYRKKRWLSQDKLSKIANIAQISIIKIESGDIKNPGIFTVQKIARALKVNIDKLI